MSETNQGYDREEPRPILVGVAVGSILVFTFATGIILRGWFDRESRESYVERVLRAPTEQIDKLRAESDVRLHKYGWVDQKAGVVHMPIDKGMELALMAIKAQADEPKGDKADTPKKDAAKGDKPETLKTVAPKTDTPKTEPNLESPKK